MSDLPVVRQLLARRILMEAADDDYICARMCAQTSLPQHFAWNAGQAIEKYLKCIVVLDGKSVKGYSHNFFKLFSSELFKSNRKLFPPKIDLRSNLKFRESLKKHTTEPFEDCIQRFEAMGRPSIRYRTVSILVKPYDLQKLDRLTFLLRRLCMPFPDEISECHEHIHQLETDFYYSPTSYWPTTRVSSGPTAERKLGYLKFENTAHFPETISTSKGWMTAHMSMSPKTVLRESGMTTQRDEEWLNSVLKQ